MQKSTHIETNQHAGVLSIGDRLRMWRRSQGLTQLELGAALDVDVGTLRKYELGVNVPGALFLVKALAAGLNINWVLSGKGEMAKTCGLISLSGEPANQLSALGDALAVLRAVDEGKYTLLMRGFTSRVHEATRLAQLEKIDSVTHHASLLEASPLDVASTADSPPSIDSPVSETAIAKNLSADQLVLLAAKKIEDSSHLLADEFPDLITRPSPLL